MDKKYLNSLQGSPYVDEGLWDRVSARGAAGIQRFKGVTGMGWEPLEETRIKSLWRSFTKKVRDLVKDFNYELVEVRLKGNNRQEDMVAFSADIQAFKELGELLVDKRNFSQWDLQSIMGKTPPTDPERLSNQQRAATKLPSHGVNQGVNYDQPSITKKPSKIAELIKEANIFGKYVRPVEIVMAFQSNDTAKTIQAFKTQIKKVYQQFLNDVNYITKVPVSYVARNIVSKMPEWTKVLNKIEETSGLPKTELPQQSPPEGDSSGGEGGMPPTGGNLSSGENQPEGNNAEPKIKGDIDLNVIIEVIKLIESRVESDPKRSNGPPHYYLSTPIEVQRKKRRHFDKPSVTFKSQPGVPQAPSAPISEEETEDTDIGPEPIDPSDPEGKKGFLYRFRQEYRKNTGSFTYGLGSFEYNNKIYEVLWHSFGVGESGHGYANDIRVKIWNKDSNDPPKSAMIFYFWDHEIDPATGLSEKFSIPRLFMEAHPDIPYPFTPEDEAYLKQFEEYFHRCLFAVTHRKALEYKVQLPPKGKEAMKRLMAMGWDEAVAEKFVGLAIKDLGSNADPKDLAELAEQLRDQSESGGLVSKTQPMIDAEKALMSPIYKMSPDVAKGLVKKAITLHGNDASAELLTASALEISKGGTGNSPKVMAMGGKTPGQSSPVVPPPPAPSPSPTSPAISSAPLQTVSTSTEVPKISDNGTVEWQGKVTKYPQAPSKALLAAIQASGQKEKYLQILAALKAKSAAKKAAGQAAQAKKKKLTEFVNPYVSVNFIQ